MTKLIVLIILIISQVIFAQLNPNNLVQFNEKDGLPGAEIGEVLQDHLGYIWVPALGGLARFNGYEFKRYLINPNDTTAIKTSTPVSLFEDSKRNIWIGGTNSLEVYDPNKNSFKNYGYPVIGMYDVLTNVNSIIEDSKGRIYLGLIEHGMAVFQSNSSDISHGLLYYDMKDDAIKRYDSHNGLIIKSVYKLISDSKNNIWILSNSGLFKIDKNNHLSRVYSPADEIVKTRGRFNDLKIDSNGIIWITGYNSKFFMFDPGTEEYETFSLNGLFKGYDDKLETYSIAIDKFDNVWLGSELGLIFYDRKKKQYKIFRNETERHIERVGIFGLGFDSFGSLWIGTLSSGLLKYDERTLFESYGHNEDNNGPLTEGWANRIIEGQNGKVWITTGASTSTLTGINEFDPVTRKIKKYFIQKLLPDSDIWGIYQLSEDEFYLSNGLGIYLFSSKNNSVKKIILKGVPENAFINEFYKDSRKNLWLCTNEGIYKRGTIDAEFSYFNLESLVDANNISNQVNKCFESKYHGLWFLTDNGLFSYNYNADKIERHGFNIKAGDVFLSQDINSFYEDNDGIAWVGTWQGGLSRYSLETGRIKNYTMEDGLPSMSIQGVLGDEENNTLWLSTFDGLSMFDKKSEKFSNFSTADGIQGRLFADCSYFKTSGGLFIFGGSNGITVFNPNDVVRNQIPPKVFLTDLKLFDKSVLPGKNSILEKPIFDSDVITLDHDDNNVSLEFIALHYLNPSKNQYAYILENYEKDWRNVGNQRVAYYPNLPPGEYLFRVKASNNHDLWNEIGASLKIIINPPWWKTWWAYSIYTIAFVGLLFFIRRYELSRQNLKHGLVLERVEAEKYQEIDRMKSRFFANISHEFRTPLTLLLGPAEKILSKSSDENITKEASLIKRNSKRLLQLVNQLLDLSKLDSGKLKLEASLGNIVTFIKGAALSFESLSESKDIMLKIKSSSDLIEVYFDKEKMMKVMSNLLSNAFKFTPIGGKVFIAINETSNNTVEIKIKNTGIGIPQEELTKLFDRFYQVDSTHTKEHEGTGIGLALTKELLELHHGSITVDSEIGKWTEFTINLLLGREHLKDEEIITTDETLAQKEIPIEEEEYYDSEVMVETDADTDESKTVILVVEDNYDMREYIKESLCDHYVVEEAVNGEQGMRIAEKIIPDLIISDLMMPKMDGNELTRILKNDERTSHIPIIILTAKSGQENKIEGLETGADDYLTKPFDIKELQVRVENLINIRKKLQEKFSKGDFLYKPSGEKIKSVDEKFLAKVIKVIEEHLSEEEFSIEECGNEVGMSRTHLYKKIKALVGKSPSQYVRSVRLNYAKKMIEEGKGNISEIAYSVGFSSPAYFSRCFKVEFGYPPSNILS